MTYQVTWKPVAWALVGLIAGSILAPVVVNASSTSGLKHHVKTPSQSVLASEDCSEPCSTTIQACGTLGGAIALGNGTITITDANGVVYWKADPSVGGSGITRFSDVFTPGVFFQTDLTITTFGAVRYILYGNQFPCEGR